MTNLLNKLTKWLESLFRSRTPAVVKQIKRQGFVSREDLFQLASIEPRISWHFQELARLAERKVDVYTFTYVLDELCGVKLDDIKEK